MSSNPSVTPQVVLLHPDDNVLISVVSLSSGSVVAFDGREYRISQDLALGHKLARSDLPAGTKVVRYGAPIGSLYCDVKAGEWVHMHNLKSDYLASHSRKGRTQGSSRE